MSRPKDARHLACMCELELSRVYAQVLNAYAQVLNAVCEGVEGVRVGVECVCAGVECVHAGVEGGGIEGTREWASMV